MFIFHVVFLCNKCLVIWKRLYVHPVNFSLILLFLLNIAVDIL